MSLPAGGFITTRDGKRCTAVPKTVTSSSTTSTEEATTTNSSNDDNDNDDAGNSSDDVATKTVDPAVNVVLGSSTAIQDAPVTTTADAAATIDTVVGTPSDTVAQPTTTPVAEIDPAAVANQFGVTTSTPTPTPTQTAQQDAIQQDPGSVTNPPIIVSDTTTSDLPTVPIEIGRAHV